jgi:pilus assembly protein Flp/PilA
VDNKNHYFIQLFIQGDIIMLFAAKEKGQGLVEYALILVLVAIVVIVVLALLGPVIGNVFSNIMAALENPGG